MRIISAIAAAAAALLAGGSIAHASPFGPGEQTVLEVDYSGLRAGTATITVGNATKMGDREVWPIVTLADTESLFSLFPIHDKFVTWWSFAQSHSVGWDFYANENRHNRRERVKLNAPALGKAMVQRQTEGDAPALSTPEMNPDAQDIAAAFFALRSLPLKPGAEFKVPVFTGRHSWDMVARVGQPEELDVDAGRFSALPLDVEVHFEGKLESKRALKVWLSNDPHHALLKLQAELALGTLNAEAREYHPGNDVEQPQHAEARNP